MFAIDTNLLVYAAVRSARDHERARQWLYACARGSERWVTTWSVLYEFLRVTTHRGARAPVTFWDARDFVDELFRSPTFGVLVETDRHAAVLTDLARDYPQLSGNIMHDLHTVALMREHGVREIHTADRDFTQFGELRVVNPLAA
ncbi:MAG: PIN domain-containing protein [Candidatus Eremiobacteraeota bacterium]|nr:PIN domain-containing protein [Candidatus Eremiobacteraeota bacterium]